MAKLENPKPRDPRKQSPQVVVAGHICIDVVPQFSISDEKPRLEPGALLEVGPAAMTLGGAVGNTGIALRRLGVSTRLVGRVGEDLFGDALIQLLRDCDPALARFLIRVSGQPTSYSAIFSPPGVDRIIFHCPGANDGFSESDLPETKLQGGRILHFGYPTLLKRIWSQDGQELTQIMRRAKRLGLITSLDVSRPDPATSAGQIDWRAYLHTTLPDVDVFLPSLEELTFMLDRPRFERDSSKKGGLISAIDGPFLTSLGDQVVEFGAAAAILKLGDQGLYLRTTNDPSRLESLKSCLAESLRQWRGRELLAPSFNVTTHDTTGAGDAAIAGFLAGLLRDLPPEETLQSAAAAGASSVESSGATRSVPDWQWLQERIRSGWERRPVSIRLPGWQWIEYSQIWQGPHDAL